MIGRISGVGKDGSVGWREQSILMPGSVLHALIAPALLMLRHRLGADGSAVVQIDDVVVDQAGAGAWNFVPSGGLSLCGQPILWPLGSGVEDRTLPIQNDLQRGQNHAYF